MKTLYFKHIDLKVNSGDLVGIIGPNGSGKTSLIKMMCGKIKNDYIFIDGKNINEFSLSYKQKNIVSVFNDNIFNTDSVLKELKFYLEKLNTDKLEIDNRVVDFINYFKLNNLIDERFINLSTENRIFIKILSLLIINPSIFNIDDLLTYLSNDKKNMVLNYIKNNNITLLCVISDMEELLLMDKCLVLNNGKKMIYDNVDRVLSNEVLLKKLGLSLPFIYDINNMLKSYELIDDNHIVYKELVDILWK